MSEEQVLDREGALEQGQDPPADEPPQDQSETEKTSIEAAPFAPLEEQPADPAQGGVDIEQVLDLQIDVSVVLAATRRSIGEILKIRPGAVLELDREVDEPVDILVNGTCLAKGEVVTVGDRYGVRITEILDPEARVLLAGGST